MSRIILHLDMNSYFATMEQQAYPSLRGKPVGVAGKGQNERTVITGASIEAKKFGLYSGISTWEAKRLCPELIIIPADYDRYIFTSKRIFSLLERFTPTVDVFSIDECFLELPNSTDWATAEKMAHQIKKLIQTQIGSWLTCSIGISYGKTLAKLASELQKPDGLVVIRLETFAKMAAVTPVQELCGVGHRIRPRLNQLGITTISELGAAPPKMLIQTFGNHTGSWLHRIGNGLDDDILRSFRDLPQEKSVGHSYTLPRDVNSLEDAKKVLLLLSERVGVRLRRKNLIGRTVSVYIRFNDRTGWGQRKCQKEFVLDGYQIYQAGVQLIQYLPPSRPIRLVAITISDLAKQTETTRPLFETDRRHEQLIKAVDRVNSRYGEFTVHRAVLAKIKSRIFNLPDGRVKRLYLPQVTEVNPFTKRI
ncbi:MAG TPA: DNA polymerase IV [Candidatus Saccharimonadales bacterium]|nr:DNA polymerase IV [Candidatus Saccharimonadales bacterium]